MMRSAAADHRRPSRRRTKPALQPLGPTHLTLCSHPQCKKAYAMRAALTREGLANDIKLRVAEAPTFCRGSCPHGPYLGLPSLGLFYGGLEVQEAADIVTETCLFGRLLFHRLLISPLTVTDGRVHYSREDGVLVLLEEERCPLEAAAYLFRFNADESCGKCTPCRLGVPNVEILLRRFENGGASKEDAELINLLVHAMYRDAYCEFAGKVTAPLRLLLEVAPEHIEKHLVNGCPRAGASLSRLGKGGRDGE